MKSMEEFRAAVYEKAERRREEQRRNRRGVMRVSLLSFLCVGIVLSVYLGNVMRGASQRAPDNGTEIGPASDGDLTGGMTGYPSGQGETEVGKSSDPKESTAGTVLTSPAPRTTARTWSVETTNVATFSTSTFAETVLITSTPARTVFLTDGDILLEADGITQEWKMCFSDRASLLSFFGEEREAHLAKYTDGFFAEHDLYAIWVKDTKPSSYTLQLLGNGEWSFIIAGSAMGEEGKQYLFFAPVEKSAN